MPTVVFLDMDGTLWEWGKVPPSAIEAIHAAQAKGHRFLTNTGRARSEVPDLAFLGLDGYCFASGSEVIIDGQHIVDEHLDEETVHAIASLFDSLGLNYNYEGCEASWMTVHDEATHAAIRAESGDKPDPIMDVPLSDTMTPEDYRHIHKLFYHSFDADYEAIKAQMPEGVTLTYLGQGFAEATKTGVDKATAMEQVRSYLGADWRTMAIGDSDNDLPMLEAADVAVAMGNGNDAAKAAATWVTTGIHEDGLANALAHFGLV